MLGDPGAVPSDDSSRAAMRSVRRRRSRKGLVAVLLLSVALAAAAAVLAFYYLELDAANARIADQERQLEEQRVLIEKKETFGAAMNGLMDTAGQFTSVQLASIVPVESFQSLASRGWFHRWDGGALDQVIADVLTAANELDTLQADASAQAAANSTGTTYEAVIDRLGKGFVTSVIDDADALCDADVLACVSSDDPLTIHFDKADMSLPYMDDWLHTGIAYHEYAHVLQMTNPAPTETALESFGGDEETMADCFALVYLDGWKLDHRIWMSSYEYWDVEIGYGHVCDSVQRTAVRDWYEQLGFQPNPITP